MNRRPVHFRPETGVKDDQHPAVRPMANEATQPLLQREHRERHLVLVERFSATCANGVNSCAGDGIARRCKRELVHDDAAQCFADNIYALPETRGRKEHGVGRFPKLLQELRPRGRTLHEDRYGSAISATACNARRPA